MENQEPTGVREDIGRINASAQEQAERFLKLLEEHNSNLAEIYREAFFPEDILEEEES